MPEDAGAVPKGTPYSASDPELMLWTVAVIADSAQCFYELLVQPLSAEEREALWQDYIRFAELFGMPRSAAPASYREFRRYWHRKLSGEEMFLTEEARYLGYATAFEIPLPRNRQLGKRVHDLLMLGSLPPRVRELYGVPYSRRQAVAFDMAGASMRAARRLMPRRMATGWNTASFDLVAKTERWRIEHEKPTPQMRDSGPVGIRLPA